MKDKFDQLVAHIRGLMECEARACAHISKNMPAGPERRARLKLHQDRYRTYEALTHTATLIGTEDTKKPVMVIHAN